MGGDLKSNKLVTYTMLGAVCSNPGAYFYLVLEDGISIFMRFFVCLSVLIFHPSCIAPSKR